MKSTLFTAVAALALAGPIAASPASAQQDQHRDHSVQQGQYQGPAQIANDQDASQNEDRDHRDHRQAWRDDRRDARWDAALYNGYYSNGRWTYGPPSDDGYRRADFALGYRPWSAGQSLGYYSGRFDTVDYRRENLRRPMRGTHWVRDDRGDYLLVSRSGRVMQVVVSGHRPRDRHLSWRDDHTNARWDDARHNGYYRDNRWTYGPPPSGERNVTLGYQPWQRGQHLGYYNGRYSEVDYRSNRGLRAPPRGYHWVRDDGGDYLLAAIAGGLIAEVILSAR